MYTLADHEYEIRDITDDRIYGDHMAEAFQVNREMSSGESRSEETRSKEPLRRAFWYGAAAVFLIVFTAIYYQFSHGVYSPFMTFSFLLPLLFGSGVNLLLYALHMKEPGYFSGNVYPSGIAALTMSFLLKAIFDIAGNSSPHTPQLFFAGVILLAAGGLAYLVGTK